MPINYYRKFDFGRVVRTLEFPIDHPDANKIVIVPREDERTSLVPRDHPLSLYWRGWVGTFIADNLGWDLDQPWHLDDFPSGYTFVRQRRIKDPHLFDPYLYGPGGKKRFRSPMEFAFHAVWLHCAEYNQNHSCECRLDTRRSQRLIEAIWFAVPGYPPPVAEDAPERPEGGYPKRRGRAVGPATLWRQYNLVEASVIDQKCRHPKVEPEDQRVDLTLARQHRPGELVWVAIDPLTPSQPANISSDNVIKFWPAFVVRAPNAPRQIGGPQEYSLRLLGISDITEYKAASQRILSWGAYDLSETVRNQLETLQLPGDVTPTFLDFKRFQPLPPSTPGFEDLPRTFENGLGPLALGTEKTKWFQERYSLAHHYIGFDPKIGRTQSYQGIWWGAEMIWEGDLVRLTCSRKELLSFLALGGGAATFREASPGANDLPLLARIFYIHVMEEKGNAGEKTEEVRFHCTVYEMADARWNDAAEDLADKSAEQKEKEHTFPNPPRGYRFRKITPNNVYAYLPFSLVAGRLDTTPLESEPHRALLGDVVTAEQVLHLRNEVDGDSEVDERTRRLMDLLVSGGLLVDNPWTYRVSPAFRVTGNHPRGKMLQTSDKEAKKTLWERVQRSTQRSASGSV